MGKLTKDLDERVCPGCKRLIVVENGRWSRHTDPRTWDRIARTMEQCPRAGQLVTPAGLAARKVRNEH